MIHAVATAVEAAYLAGFRLGFTAGCALAIGFLLCWMGTTKP